VPMISDFMQIRSKIFFHLAPLRTLLFHLHRIIERGASRGPRNAFYGGVTCALPQDLCLCFTQAPSCEYFWRARRREDRLGPSLCAPPRKPFSHHQSHIIGEKFRELPEKNQKERLRQERRNRQQLQVRMHSRAERENLSRSRKCLQFVLRSENRFVVVYISGALAVLFVCFCWLSLLSTASQEGNAKGLNGIGHDNVRLPPRQIITDARDVDLVSRFFPLRAPLLTLSRGGNWLLLLARE
jgi:hypothetical protein